MALVEIIPFEASHQPGIDLLYKEIEEEFPEQVFPDSPVTITQLSRMSNRIYWVATVNGKVIGTAGLVMLKGQYCGLKSMFLAKEFRGDKRQIAKQLLQTAIDRAKEQGCKCICLGTMEQFKAAKKFYEKHGFVQVTQEKLPADFPLNTVDTVFYCKVL